MWIEQRLGAAKSPNSNGSANSGPQLKSPPRRPRGPSLPRDEHGDLKVKWRVGGLEGQITRARGFGFGLQWNIILGIVGAVIGAWLFPALGLEPFAGFGLMGVIGGAIIGVVIVF